MEKNSEANLSKWVEDYGDGLYTWASYKLNDTDLAKDLVQETFIAALQGWSRFEGRSSVKTWLLSILNNKIRDHFRKDKSRMFSLENLAGERNIDDFFDDTGAWKQEHRPSNWKQEDAQLLDQPEFRNLLYRCMDALSERYRLVMVGKYLETKDSVELCQELGISATNFWQILHRAKLQLRTCIDKGWFSKNK